MKTQYQQERFTFVNDTNGIVTGLAVTFDERDVRAHTMDHFAKAVSNDETITLTRGNLPNGEAATIFFEREGSFNIVSWQWVGPDGSGTGVKNGPPV